MTDQPQEAARSAGGRPSKYKPDYCARVIEGGRVGKSMAAIAALDLDIAESTLWKWAEEHPEFSEAIKSAQRLALAWWEEQGRVNLEEGEKKFNHVLWYMNMKNRHGWADKQEIKAEVSLDLGDRLRRGIDRVQSSATG